MAKKYEEESDTILKRKHVESEISTGPNWLELPRDLIQNILERLSVVEIVTSACLVCPLWWNICKEPTMWCTINMSNNHYTSSHDLEKICMYAVDRSCGQVEDISIEYFGNQQLLKYIADSTSCLRSLRLANCWDHISELKEVAKKLPLLEKLDISTDYISKDTFEVIGSDCPNLKSLKISISSFISFFGFNHHALAIGKSMPELRNLKITAHLLTHTGVVAILDGCPLLESLDLRDCDCLFLSGSWRKRCHERIKNFLLPDDF